MIFEELPDGTYIPSCIHDPDRTCCLSCQELAAKKFIYQGIPRSKWPVWLQGKFKDITKEQVAKEIEDYKNSPERTNNLLEKILRKLDGFPF